MNRNAIKKAITESLNSESTLNKLAQQVERLMNTEIPGTPRLTGRGGPLGSRVMYVALPGKGKNREALSARAGEVLKFLDKNRKASSAALQKAIKVNRNVIAGAIHELKQAGVVKTERFNPEGSTSAAGFSPTRRRRKA